MEKVQTYPSKFAGMRVVVSKLMPDNKIAVFGTACRYCGKPMNPLEPLALYKTLVDICFGNGCPDGHHLVDYWIINIDELPDELKQQVGNNER